VPPGRPKLLADENFPMPSVRRLRDEGIDVVAVIEDCPAASDSDILLRAREEGRWLVTYDRDFGELVFRAGHPPPPAILYFRQEPRPATRAAELILLLMLRAEEVAGHLVSVGDDSFRFRPLPS
jgi:predicted nuclease of predicted toxin-antitoxin system